MLGGPIAELTPLELSWVSEENVLICESVIASAAPFLSRFDRILPICDALTCSLVTISPFWVSSSSHSCGLCVGCVCVRVQFLFVLFDSYKGGSES